jgi:hypothetical protein
MLAFLPWGPSRAKWAVSTPTSGNVNDADAAILAAHWGEGGGEESVPETVEHQDRPRDSILDGGIGVLTGRSRAALLTW